MKDLHKTLILAVVPATILAFSIAWTFRYQTLSDYVSDRTVILDRWSGSLYAIAPGSYVLDHEDSTPGISGRSLQFIGVAVDLEK